jgi:uncharacterized protein
VTSLQSMLDLVLGVPPSPWQGPIPVPDRDSGPFWDGLRRHQLLIMRCAECGYWVHPPLAGCPRCLSPDLRAEPVSGRGTVYSFTVVNREFAPGIKPPYVVAYVDLEEQESLRFTTNLVNVQIGDIRIGMPVQVLFHDAANMTLALFEPLGGSAGV